MARRQSNVSRVLLSDQRATVQESERQFRHCGLRAARKVGHPAVSRWPVIRIHGRETGRSCYSENQAIGNGRTRPQHFYLAGSEVRIREKAALTGGSRCRRCRDEIFHVDVICKVDYILPAGDLQALCLLRGMLDARGRTRETAALDRRSS